MLPSDVQNCLHSLMKTFQDWKREIGWFLQSHRTNGFDPVYSLFSNPLLSGQSCRYENLNTKHIYCIRHTVLDISHIAEKLHFQTCQLSLLNIMLPKIIVYIWCSFPTDFLLFNYMGKAADRS